ncbi:interleukin-12 receptor subunit beta-2-like [Diretmus argenteus]
MTGTGSFISSPLLLAGCHSINCLGYLTVEPAPLFLMGSDLTVYCHITQQTYNGFSKYNRRFRLVLELNDQTLEPGERVNRTTERFRLVQVSGPNSKLICKLRVDGMQEMWTVCGLNLRSGLPPDKPTDISCQTSRNSDVIDCSWNRGQETHLITTYNVSVTRENGTQIHYDWIQSTGELTVPRTVLDENVKYQLSITAYNHFGCKQSDPFVLCVKNVEDKGTELSNGLIRVDGLEPLTEYEFQIRVCYSTLGLTPTKPPSSKRLLCSKWSPSIRRKSPGKGPSQQLHVWRALGTRETNGLHTVTVLWKPLPPWDYSGEVQQYKIFVDYGQKQEFTCPAAVSQCSIQVSPGVPALSVSAVTSYGKSPLAAVSLRTSGVSGPIVTKLAGNGSDVVVSWSWSGTEHRSRSGGTLLYYVKEWTSGPVALHWQRVAKDRTTTLITGLTAGVRYNVSLYAVTTRGVSNPSSGLVYSKEKKPGSAPKVSVLVREARRIWIQWEELAVDQQKGFITNYTIYLRGLDSSHTEQRMTVSGSGPRQMWLDCPEGALSLGLSASTSAGEGPRVDLNSSPPPVPAVGLVAGFAFSAILFLLIIANLMCWSCVRKRIKQKCTSLGPAWLVENLPKPENSCAIALLRQECHRSVFEPLQFHSDPPLSPIEEIEESGDLLEGIHAGPGQAITEATSQTTDTGIVLSERSHFSYKPQITTSAPQGEETEEMERAEQRQVPAWEQGDGCSVVSGGLVGGLLSNVEVEFSSSSMGLTLSSVSGIFRPKTPETSMFNRDILFGESGTENEAGTTSLDLQQGEPVTPNEADSFLSHYMVETTLLGGYFPQVAALNSD